MVQRRIQMVAHARVRSHRGFDALVRRLNFPGKEFIWWRRGTGVGIHGKGSLAVIQATGSWPRIYGGGDQGYLP
jgi:hypothetical protein